MMTTEDIFYEIYDLLEPRLNQLGHVCTDDAWEICKDKTQRSYGTIGRVFRETMMAMVEQGKAEIVKNGQYKILKPNQRKMKSTTFVRHILGPFEDQQQFCVICGEKICDYRNAMFTGDGPPPRGWAEGELFIQGKNPTCFFSSIDGVLEEGDVVVDCNKK